MFRNALAAALVLAIAPGLARPADDQGPTSQPQATPDTSPPAEAPPAPPAKPPAPPEAEARNAQPGQWVYTQQYGWIWMPYSESYTYVPPDGVGEPYSYVYYPVYGWTWVVAPWIWGFGPWPYFVYGPRYYPWYVHGWWRTPWRWHYRPAPYHAYVAHGVRAVPYRGGYVVHAPGRAFVGHVGRGGGHGHR